MELNILVLLAVAVVVAFNIHRVTGFRLRDNSNAQRRLAFDRWWRRRTPTGDEQHDDRDAISHLRFNSQSIFNDWPAVIVTD